MATPSIHSRPGARPGCRSLLEPRPRPIGPRAPLVFAAVDDLEVLDALVKGGSRRAFGPSLHIEGDCLFFDGWWQAMFRVGPTTFSIRDEEPPGKTTILADAAEALRAMGLQEVPASPALLYAITYTEIALGLVQWKIWSTDLDTANEALSVRAGHDAFLNDYDTEGIKEADYSAELGGARRNAGLPPSIILTVGVDPDKAMALGTKLEDCRVVTRALGEIRPDACGSLIPTLIMVDTTGAQGREFAMELKAAACGRFIPVVAVTDDGVPPGADSAVSPSAEGTEWADPVRSLLP